MLTTESTQFEVLVMCSRDAEDNENNFQGVLRFNLEVPSDFVPITDNNNNSRHD